MTYLDQLHELVAVWIREHPTEYKAIRVEVLAGLRRTGKPDPVKGTILRRTIDSAVIEVIRKRNGWASERAYENGERLPVGGAR